MAPVGCARTVVSALRRRCLGARDRDRPHATCAGRCWPMRRPGHRTAAAYSSTRDAAARSRSELPMPPDTRGQTSRPRCVRRRVPDSPACIRRIRFAANCGPHLSGPQFTEGARTPRFVRPVAGLRCDARRSMQRCVDRSPHRDPSTIPHLRMLVMAARIRATPRSVRTSGPPWRRSGDRGRCTRACTRPGRAASLHRVA